MYTIAESRRFLLVALATVSFCLVFSCLADSQEISDQTASIADFSNQTPRDLDQLRLLQQRVRKVVRLGRLATVSLEQDDAVGSGVIISPEGLILTAGHVCVEPNRKIWIRFSDDSRVRGLTLGVNHPIDSGMAKIIDDPPTDKGWPYVDLSEELADSGDWVVALGQPNGFVLGRAPPVRLGRVLVCDEESINTDAALVGGDSGGPLINLMGQLIGIHSRIGERITSNYHVPVVAFRTEWDLLVAGRMTGVPDGEDPENSRSLAGMAVRFQGNKCFVTQVFLNGAADEAGVEPDDVILRCGDHEPRGAESFARYMLRQEAYDRIPLVLSRSGEIIETELWLGRSNRSFPGIEPADMPSSGEGAKL